MNKALQALIAITCIVVIAACGLWLYDRNELREAAERDKAARLEATRLLIASEAKAREDAKARASQEAVVSCQRDLEARENGDIGPMFKRAKGGDMMAEVRKCEELVKSAKD